MTLTETLIQGGLIKQIQTPKPFYQGLFGQQFLAQSDTIVFDDVYEDYRGIAKFVAPNVVASVNQNKAFEVKSFRPAYAKEKDVIEAWSDTLQARIAGEEIGGSLDPKTRAMKMRAKQLRMHRIKMENLFEFMCFQAFASGSLTFGGDAQYPKTTVSYFRDPSLTVTTLGAKAWTAANANPLESISEMVDRVYNLSQEEVDTIIMGRTAWRNFYNYFTAKERQHLLDRNIRGSDLTLNLLWVGDVRGVEMVARFTSLNGQTIEVYVDNRSYLSADNRATRYVSDNEIIGFSSGGFKGVQAFGAIKDADAGWVATRMFHKEFRQDEPSADFLLTQSAPLPIVLNPNTVFRVLDVNS